MQEAMVKNNLGALPSPPDERDIDLGQVQSPVKIPDVFLPSITIPINWQDGLPICGSGAGSHFKEIQEYYDSGIQRFSMRYLWDKIKKIDGVPPERGTYARAVFKVLKKWGISPENLYASNVFLSLEKFTEDLTDSTDDRIAAQYRIKSYARLNSPLTFEKLKQAIYKNKVVFLLIHLDKGWWNTAYPTFTTGEWGHFIIATGYNENSIRIICSADEGTPIKYINKKYLNYIREAWTAVDISNIAVKLLTSKVKILRQMIGLYLRLIGAIRQLKGRKK